MGIMQFGCVIEPYRCLNKTSIIALPVRSIIFELVSSLTFGKAGNRDNKTGCNYPNSHFRAENFPNNKPRETIYSRQIAKVEKPGV